MSSSSIKLLCAGMLSLRKLKFLPDPSKTTAATLKYTCLILYKQIKNIELDQRLYNHINKGLFNSQFSTSPDLYNDINQAETITMHM